MKTGTTHSSRTIVVCFWLLAFLFLSGGCSFGTLFAPPSPTPTATLRPRPRATATETATVVDTSTPTDVPPTITATSKPTDVPPTATNTAPPAATATRRPTFTPRPPTATFTPAPPASTSTPAFALTFNWINGGRPYNPNECNTFPNGTHLEGMVRHSDGSLITGAKAKVWMHQWIKGQDSGPYAYPGVPKDFPNWTDGRWDAEFPKWSKDFEWHISMTPKSTDDVISADLSGVASAAASCGQPATKNFYIVDWIAH